MASAPKITLYTNHGCPWAHRAHIALAELKVPFEEEIIDLSVPRTPEYLKINPRGLVPSISYNGQILTESAIVATFLADAFPPTLLPPSTDPDGPLTRAKINFFVDTYFSKAAGIIQKALIAASEADRDSLVNDFLNTIIKEIEPQLSDAAPFFGGSSKLTLAEVLTGSFILRLYTFPKHGLAPESILTSLAEKAPAFDKWSKAVIAHPSVTAGIWNEEKVVAGTKARLAQWRASA